MEFSQVLLAHAGPSRARLEAVPDLEQILTRLVETGRAAWPQVGLSSDDFLRHLAECLPEDGDPAVALNATRADDLYLACACALGDARALEEFERHFMSRVAAEVARSQVAPELDDEGMQRLRARLLVADGTARPRIAGYHGRGPLGAWLFVAAARTAINMRHAARDHDQTGEVVQHIASADADPELGYLKVRYGKELESALRAALSTLSPRESAILRLTFLEDMTGDAIARIYGVSRRTVVRWLADIRGRLTQETQRLLAERLRLSPSEFDSLVNLVRSQIGVSLHERADEPGE